MGTEYVKIVFDFFFISVIADSLKYWKANQIKVSGRLTDMIRISR